MNNVCFYDVGSAQADVQTENNDINYRGGRHKSCTQLHLTYQTDGIGKTMHE